jgi:mono/diheme cytochrome c family protein
MGRVHRRITTIAAFAVFGGLSAGCGQDRETSTPPDPAATRLFAQNCGGCHTLAAAGTDGRAGPNLDEVQLDPLRISTQVRNGGGDMPPFGGRLSDAEIGQLVEYVSSVAGEGS